MKERADRSWLTERVSVEEAEKASMPTAQQLARNPKLPNKPFAFHNEEWKSLKSQIVHGDELWYFCSPPQTWRDLAGRAGLAVLRDGNVVHTMVVLMN
jgi:hypothetical protein